MRNPPSSTNYAHRPEHSLSKRNRSLIVLGFFSLHIAVIWLYNSHVSTLPCSLKGVCKEARQTETEIVQIFGSALNSSVNVRIPVYNKQNPTNNGVFASSRYLRDTQDPDGEGVVWIANWISFPKPRCQALMDEVLASHQRRKQQIELHLDCPATDLFLSIDIGRYT
jgi:hypothetical protein